MINYNLLLEILLSMFIMTSVFYTLQNAENPLIPIGAILTYFTWLFIKMKELVLGK